MGWESNSVFQVLIVTGGSKSGVFVYSPAPGFGHLVASITAISGTDPFGNAYLAEVAVYDTVTGIAVSLTGDALQFWAAPGPGGPWAARASVAGDAGGDLLLNASGAGQIKAIELLAALASLTVTGGLTADTEIVTSGQAGGLVLRVVNTTANPTGPNLRIDSAAAGDLAFALRVTGDTFNRLVLDDNGTTGGRIRAGTGALAVDTAIFRAAAAQWAADPIAFNNAGAAEVSQTVGGTGAAFAGTWANAPAPGVPLQYRRNAAPFKTVQWVGRVTNTVAQVAGSAITAAVPAAYRPANTHDITCFNLTSGAVVRVSIGSTGVLTCQSAIAANDLVGIPDTSLDLNA